MVRFLFTFALIGSCACAWAGADVSDSIKSQKLNEVVVVGERAWMEDGKAIFVPNRSEKRRADDAASLIKTMHIPVLNVKDGNVTSLSGEQIVFFINGLKATDSDMKAFWPKEVRRVVYIGNPTDPKYQGAKHVVDFIMDKYVVGGVTRGRIMSKVPGGIGIYNLASKLAYKKMSFGATLFARHSRDHRALSEGTETYKDFYYDGVKYDKLEHALKEHIYEREDYVNAAFNARYSTDNFVATHTLGFVWSHNPGSGSGSRDVWSHNIFDSQSSTSFSKGRASSPQVSGEYFARLSKKVGLLGYWQYSHSNSRQEFASQFVPSPEISNLTKEHVNSCKFLVQPYFKPSSKLFFQLTVESMLDWYKTYYSGSTEAKALQARQELKSNLRASWKPLDNIILTFKPGLSASLWKIGGTRQHSVRPTVEADLNASFGSKFYLSTSAIVYMRSPSASESNPTVVRSSELLWLAGDPGLKSLFSWNLSNQLTFLAARWLDFSWGVSYSRSSNQIIPSYKAATSGMGGIIKMMQNAPAENDISTSMTVTGKFFDGDLSVYLSPKLFYFDVNGKYASKFTFATVSGGIDYYYKDFSFSVWYDNPYKDISMAGMERSWEEGSWSASVDYGNDNLKLRLRVDDIFNDKKKSWTKYESPTFSSMLNSFKTGRQISLSVSYVFGYGKKVSQSIDVESPSSIKTSVIRGRGL